MKKLITIVVILIAAGAGGAVFYAKRGDKESTVSCRFARRASPRYTYGTFASELALSVIRSVAFGCARDRLEFHDGFEDERAKSSSKQSLSFSVPRACETVYARFVLENGSQSSLLVAPVLSEGR